jgi:hypothetical protein
MNRKRAIVLSCFALVLAGAVGLLAPPVRLFFALNRLKYLVNDHRYLEAMRQWERLARRRPDVRDRRSGFEREIIQRAMSYYASPAAQTDTEAKRDLGAFLDLVARHQDLAPLGRRLQLCLSLRDDLPTSDTLAGARRILDNEGYDIEALWWAVRCQYDPRRPLTIPAELLRFRKEIQQPPPVGKAVGRQEFVRLLYLRALLALADRDWARAAYLLEDYNARNGWQVDDNFPLGMVLLESGRPDAAVSHLLQYLAAHPNDAEALSCLLEAYLRLGEVAWAAATLDRLRPLDATAARRTPAAIHAPPPAPGADPIVALAAAATTTGPLHTDARLWQWLDWAARDPAQRAAVDQAADRLIAAAPDTPAAQAALLGWCLRRQHSASARRLIGYLAARPPGVAVSADAARRAAGLYLRDAAFTPGDPAAAHPVNLLLTRDATRTIDVELPAGATLLMLQAVGYASGGVWPVCHVDLGPYGSGTFYAVDVDGQGIPLLLPLAWTAARRVQATVVLSLLNATPAEDRSLFIKQILVF